MPSSRLPVTEDDQFRNPHFLHFIAKHQTIVNSGLPSNYRSAATSSLVNRQAASSQRSRDGSIKHPSLLAALASSSKEFATYWHHPNHMSHKDGVKEEKSQPCHSSGHYHGWVSAAGNASYRTRNCEASESSSPQFSPRFRLIRLKISPLARRALRKETCRQRT